MAYSHRIPTHPAAHGFRPGHSAIDERRCCTAAAASCFVSTSPTSSLRSDRPRLRALPHARLSPPGRTITRRPLHHAVADRRLEGTPEPRRATVPTTRRGNDSRRATFRKGAPTSPAVANLVAFRLDRRLALTRGRLEATYTRYADDLTFSGGAGLARGAAASRHLVAVIAGEEGFTLNHRKTRVSAAAGGKRDRRGRERAAEHAAAEFDRLKAILTNCVRHGPARSEPRTASRTSALDLAGKVAHVAAVNPVRGRKLWALFDRIAWPTA